jgi:hypothetical protein
MLAVSRLYIVDARMINAHGAIGGMGIVRGNQSIRRNLPRCPPRDLGWNPGRRSGKLATNRLSYVTACIRHKNA